MGDNASKSDRGAGLRQALRLGNWAFALLGVALVWPLVGILVFGGKGPWPEAFWVDLAPSLALIVAAAILFIKAIRR